MSQENKLSVLNDALPELKAIVALNARPGIDTGTIVIQELEYLQNISLTKPEILSCVPQSIVAAVKSVMKNNLSLDPDAGLVYIKTRNIALKKADADITEGGNVKVKKGEVTEWGKVLEIQPSINGLISIARQCGRVLDMKDLKAHKDGSGKVIGVSVEIMVPSPMGPRWELKEFDESDFERWQRASHKENSRNKKDANEATLNYANALYSSWKGGIDPEFAKSKAVRHGLKRLGTNQNERTMQTIDISNFKVVIDTAADIAAATDEGGAPVFEAAEIVQENESALPQEALPTSDDL